MRAYLVMMPRLQAEETRTAATATALGTGALKSADARRIARALDRQASDGRRPRRADRAALGMIGIAVEVVGGPPAAEGS